MYFFLWCNVNLGTSSERVGDPCQKSAKIIHCSVFQMVLDINGNFGRVCLICFCNFFFRFFPFAVYVDARCSLFSLFFCLNLSLVSVVLTSGREVSKWWWMENWLQFFIAGRSSISFVLIFCDFLNFFIFILVAFLFCLINA